MQYRNPYIEQCIEGSSSVFRSLSLPEKETLDQHHSIVVLKKGELIISEGDKPGGLFCLLSGKAKLSKVGVGGREQIIRMLRPHSFFCYRSLYGDSHYPFSVMAVDSSVVVILDRQYISAIVKQNNDVAVRFIKLMTEELAFANNRLISLTQKHVRGRIAESVLLLRDVYGLDIDGQTIRVQLSRDDIAHLSNMTTSNAIRILSDFASEGIVGLHGKKILIRDVGRLETVSESGE
jgi:CRP-like cAMP-binding protein